ncbi:DUF4233 domain-containing protein [Corynebacterium pacaense]|uniref:DUF4233 domain-containing protein n=1 Tax=Corynebacterium pacaense TaxID=1816684 RepID=UPI0009B9B993|nr:DUF4233 domain-containing protein [Corynebacterium pacaense]
MNKRDEAVEYGPLGPGHEPVKDPMKGIRGVMAGTLVMEAITIALVLTVILRVDEGAYWTTFNWMYVSGLALAMFIAAFLQRHSWSMSLNVALQVLALGGFLVHPSMGIVAIIFILVWLYLLYLRSNLVARMKRGLLTTQHM